MNSKFTLALIALVGVGVFALPSTMALFAGQHSFYNIDATGNQVPCVKCHGDVKAELNSGHSDTTGTPGPHANFKCEYCHRAEGGFAAGDDAYAKIRYSNGTSVVYLVTTIQNFETGNFPYWIKNAPAGSNIDTVLTGGYAYDINSTAFVNQTTVKYAGNLSPTILANKWYKYSYASEVALYNSTTGAPKDTQATKLEAFNARNVSWGTDATNLNESLDWSGSREVTPGTTYHAASLVSCLECHGGEQKKGAPGYQISTAEPYNHADWLVDPTSAGSECDNCHYGDPHGAGWAAEKTRLAAGGFGLTSYPNDTGSTEAHNDFVRNASQNILRTGYGAANDACVGCHTHVAVDINFQKRYVLTFAATAQKSAPEDPNSWKVDSFSAKGTVNVEEFGNGTGGAIATSNHTYDNWAPSTPMYLVTSDGTQGANVTGFNGTQSNDSEAALTGK